MSKPVSSSAEQAKANLRPSKLEIKFIDQGGGIRWTPQGAHLFIPADFINWWPAAALTISRDGMKITLENPEKGKAGQK